MYDVFLIKKREELRHAHHLLITEDIPGEYERIKEFYEEIGLRRL